MMFNRGTAERIALEHVPEGQPAQTELEVYLEAHHA